MVPIVDDKQKNVKLEFIIRTLYDILSGAQRSRKIRILSNSERIATALRASQ